jgi:UDP-N-acetylmuramoylalanine--D-glutamate ligase
VGCDVTVTDLASEASLARSLESLEPAELAAIRLRLGQHDEADFTHADLVVVNPAVPQASRFIAVARAAGARITSEVELFLEVAGAHLTLITGTQGKSSTAHLTAGLLAKSGRNVRLAGNIGRSLLAELATLQPDDELVIELSSYQLDALPRATESLAKADVAVVTNLLVDHLARHGDVASYHRAKLRIAELVRPGGLLLLPAGASLPADVAAHVEEHRITCAHFACEAPADFEIEGSHFTGPDGALAEVSSLKLPGAYQRSNALAALAVARTRGLDAAQLDTALAQLGGLEHRSQELGLFGPHATRVINNAVSTTPDSTQSAFEATADAPVVLLVGGRSKAMAMDDLVAACGKRLAALVAFGEAADEFAAAFAAAGHAPHKVATVEAAVRLGLELARPGDVLLFSPAGSSFDTYTNFEQRAGAFLAALGQASPRRAARFEL